MRIVNEAKVMGNYLCLVDLYFTGFGEQDLHADVIPDNYLSFAFNFKIFGGN